MVLEFGKAGVLGVGSGVRPVLADGAVVGTLRASHWKERRVSLWKGTWVADLEGTLVEVEKLSLWTSAHRFVSGGEQVAHGGTTGGWSPRPTLTATPGMPLHHQVFLLWLELVVRGRSGDGSGAAFGGDGGGGGGD